MKAFLIILVFIISGCGLSEEQRQGMNDEGALRHELFVECMELSAKITRQGDDDVSDIVSECSSTSYYISNGMTN